MTDTPANDTGATVTVSLRHMLGLRDADSSPQPRTAPCPVCEGAGWDWKRAADEDLQVDDPVDHYWCENCNGTGRVPADT